MATDFLDASSFLGSGIEIENENPFEKSFQIGRSTAEPIELDHALTSGLDGDSFVPFFENIGCTSLFGSSPQASPTLPGKRKFPEYRESRNISQGRNADPLHHRQLLSPLMSTANIEGTWPCDQASQRPMMGSCCIRTQNYSGQTIVEHGQVTPADDRTSEGFADNVLPSQSHQQHK